MFKDSDFNDLDDLVDEGMAFFQEKDAENQGKIVVDNIEVVKGSGDTEAVNTDGKESSIERSSRPIRSITTLQPLPTIDPKDKERDAEIALRLQAELDEELIVEREIQEEASKIAIAEMFDEVQARMDADYELAARMTQEEQEKYTIKERAMLLVEFFERRKKQLEAERAEAIKNKPPTKTQLRNPMLTYLKNMGGYKYSKRLKRVAGSYATQKSLKKPKVMKSAKDVTKEETTEYGKEKKELRLSLRIISNDDRRDLLLWGDLRMIFDLDEKDELWMNQLDWKLLRWKLYESCRVYTLFMDGTPMEINMLVEKKYPLIKELLEKMLNL
ncbi:hypothetical protein Tco_0866710 [Tanacetum coccineum]